MFAPDSAVGLGGGGSCYFVHFCSNQILSVQRYMRIVVNKKYKLIQVIGTLYRYILKSAFTCSIPLFTCL